MQTASATPQTDPRHWKSDGRPAPEIKDGHRYLVGGEIKEWQGPTKEVQSCLFFAKDDGSIERPTLGVAPLLNGDEAMRALDAAESAWGNGEGEWPTMTVAQRIEAMQGFVGRMKAVRGEVVERMMWEIGKTEPDSFGEFDRTVAYIEATIEALKNLDRASSGFSLEKGFLAQIRRSPFGPTLCMGPYNYPLNETFTTLIPAIIMGNPVISKLPRFGQLLNNPMLEAFRDSFPAGVVNIINGKGEEIITPLMRSGKIELLAFIGSSKAADLIKSEHPHPHRLKSVLSLDAKNPAIVLEDADLDVAVPQILKGALSFNGQRCTALKIVFVPRGRREETLGRLSDALTAMKSGFPWQEGVSITPVADLNAPKWLHSLVEEATSMGATVVNPGGGEMIGNYLHPALVFGVKKGMQLYDVEQFGPVIPVVEYDSLDEVREYMVQSPFGMQVSIFGYDPKVIGPLIDAMVNQVSRVNLNTQSQRGPDTFPFTGRKASAEGTLSVADALKRFSIRSLVATDVTDRNKDLVNEIVAARTSNFLRTDFLF